MAGESLFGLADDVHERLAQLLPEVQVALEEATKEWELLPADDIDWYGTARGMATSRWIGRLGALTWAMEEFCKEGGGGPEAP